MLLLALVFFSGCIGEEDNYQTYDDLNSIGERASSDQISDLENAFKKVPDGTYKLFFVNLEKIRIDRDLNDLYQTLNNRYDFSTMVIHHEDLNYFIIMGRELIISGNLNKKHIENYLQSDDFEEDTYKGVELWSKQNNNAIVVAVSNNVLRNDDKIVFYSDDISGAKEFIEIYNGEKNSFYNNEDVRDVVDKLPDGLITNFIVDLDDGFMIATSLIKENRDTMRGEYIYKAYNEYDAKNFKTELERRLKGRRNVYDVDVVQKGNYVEASAKADMEDWSELVI